MNIDTGETKSFLIEDMIDKIKLGERWVSLKNQPKKDCEFCSGRGSIYHAVTATWSPCSCTSLDKSD